MKELKFKNKNGDVSGYALLCGYIQRQEKNGKWKELFMEHRHLHVRHGVIGEAYSSWECFDDKLTEARKAYKKIKL